VDWCPFNWYRTSGDINSSPTSWYANLQTTIAFQDPVTPLSRPGCWAYPDMLEVGRINVNGAMHYKWNRAHFGAWCIVSSPLILGLDLTQTTAVAAIIDVITNKEAIAVNQEWAGHPGALVWSDLGGALGFPAARKCNPSNPALKQKGWSLKPDAAVAGKTALVGPSGGCLKIQGRGFPGGAGGLLLATCNSSDPAQAFSYNGTTKHLSQYPKGNCVDVHSGGPYAAKQSNWGLAHSRHAANADVACAFPCAGSIVWMYGCTPGPNDNLSFVDGTIQAGSSLCFGEEADDPAGSTFASTIQAWAKPMSDGVALLLINPDTKPHTFKVPMYMLPLTGGGKNLTSTPLNVRDVWAHAPLAPVSTGAVSIDMTVDGFDSAFVRLSPTTHVQVA
jgi:hypothetical protein